MNANPIPDYETTDDALSRHGVARVVVSVRWSDARATHEEAMYFDKFSVWREADLLPPAISTRVPGMRVGDRAQADVEPAETFGARRDELVVTTTPARFDRHQRPGLTVTPRVGRFYPRGFFHGVIGIFKNETVPARITSLTATACTVDFNHPMAGVPYSVQLEVDSILPRCDQRGGRCTSPLEEMLLYAGLSAPLVDGRDTDYGDNPDGMRRMDERNDRAFYTKPRLVQHLDARACQTLNQLYRRLIPRDADVLDLMASHDSHLAGASLRSLSAVGLNLEELQANPLATQRVVHDLNESATLSYEPHSFDAVLCTASVEYLTRPHDVIAGIKQLLRPGGVFVLTVSNRWFPSKAIRIWQELHEYERVGLLLQWLQQSGYERLNSFSSRGWPRPADDPYARETPYSDPLFAVWGYTPA